MALNTLKCGAVLGCGFLALASLHLPGNGCPGARILGLVCASTSAGYQADDNDKPSLSGVWVQNGAEMKIAFADKDVIKLFPHGDERLIAIVCQYTLEKEGLVKVKITELAGEHKDKVAEVVPVGLEFSFKWIVKDGTGTLEEVKGEEVEPLKSRLEGKYAQKQ